MASSLAVGSDIASESKFLKGKFQNSEIAYQSSLENIWTIAKEYWQAERVEPIPKQKIPVDVITKDSLFANTHDALYRLGH